jgi:hypothetical protein
MAGLQCLQVLYSKTRASSLGADLLVWSLLSDDDEEVRIGATSIIHDELALKTPMCRDRAAEMFWQRLLRTYHASEEWNRWLWSKVIDQPMIGEYPILMPTISSSSDGPLCVKKNISKRSASRTWFSLRPKPRTSTIRNTMMSPEQLRRWSNRRQAMSAGGKFPIGCTR